MSSEIIFIPINLDLRSSVQGVDHPSSVKKYENNWHSVIFFVKALILIMIYKIFSTSKFERYDIQSSSFFVHSLWSLCYFRIIFHENNFISFSIGDFFLKIIHEIEIFPVLLSWSNYCFLLMTWKNILIFTNSSSRCFLLVFPISFALDGIRISKHNS